MSVTFQFVFDDATMHDVADLLEIMAAYQKLQEWSNKSTTFMASSLQITARILRLACKLYAGNAEEVSAGQWPAFAAAFTEGAVAFLGQQTKAVLGGDLFRPPWGNDTPIQ